MSMSNSLANKMRTIKELDKTKKVLSNMLSTAGKLDSPHKVDAVTKEEAQAMSRFRHSYDHCVDRLVDLSPLMNRLSNIVSQANDSLKEMINEREKMRVVYTKIRDAISQEDGLTIINGTVELKKLVEKNANPLRSLVANKLFSESDVAEYKSKLKVFDATVQQHLKEFKDYDAVLGRAIKHENLNISFNQLGQELSDDLKSCYEEVLNLYLEYPQMYKSAVDKVRKDIGMMWKFLQPIITSILKRAEIQTKKSNENNLIADAKLAVPDSKEIASVVVIAKMNPLPPPPAQQTYESIMQEPRSGVYNTAAALVTPLTENEEKRNAVDAKSISPSYEDDHKVKPVLSAAIPQPPAQAASANMQLPTPLSLEAGRRSPALIIKKLDAHAMTKVDVQSSQSAQSKAGVKEKIEGKGASPKSDKTFRFDDGKSSSSKHSFHKIATPPTSARRTSTPPPPPPTEESSSPPPSPPAEMSISP